MNALYMFSYQLYLLQLENYELGRFWKLLRLRGPVPRSPMRKSLVWTTKARVLLTGAAAAMGVAVGAVWQFTGSPAAAAAAALAALVLYPVWLSLAVLALRPGDALAKYVLVGKARRIVRQNPGVKIIGIAGSYGKTTMKQVLLSVLSAKYRVIGTPDSVNTPVGVARWIMRSFHPSVEIAVVEMGEHYRGDVRELCELVRPDIAVVTGINEAHMERLKNLDNTAATIFEILEHAKPNAFVAVNADDPAVLERYKSAALPRQQVELFSMSHFHSRTFRVRQLGWEAQHAEAGKIFVELLGEYALGDVDAAVKVGKHLGMSDGEVRLGIERIRPVQHRLMPLRSGSDVLVIDDSYNGNPDGVREAIKVLGQFSGRRKVYITPGLVELGEKSREVHGRIGRQLAGVADVVILVRNSATPFIEQGIREREGREGGKRAEVVWFDSAPAAHAALPKLVKPGDVVMFQNDWGDQYL